MRGLAEFCYSRRWFVLVGWILLLVGLYGLSVALGGKFRTEFELPNSESARALQLMEERGSTSRTGFSGQVVFEADQGVNNQQVRQSITQLLSDITNAAD